MPRQRARRREKKFVPQGKAFINATFNNTLITMTDPQGNTISQSSAGAMGFKGSRKSTAFAAQRAGETAARTAI
ncbi:MAG: 30S ribosomal protein S11, partial [Chloroflexi bacterium]|nr:30S ribosomal protein S11 [Chloroflexota bacterium]